MDSRLFIKSAGPLIDRVADAGADRAAVQKEVTQLFSGLQNPTLPSAYKLRDAALANGYTVAEPVLQRIGDFDFLRSN